MKKGNEEGGGCVDGNVKIRLAVVSNHVLTRSELVVLFRSGGTEGGLGSYDKWGGNSVTICRNGGG